MKIILFIFLFTSQAFASYIESYDKLNINNKEIINNINVYFNNLNTLKTNFIQYDNSNDSMAEGLFYIQKPKKLRFEYTNPFNNLLIVNGKITTFYDIDLDEISTFPAKSLPISFLLNNNSDLESTNSTILDVIKIDENIIVKTFTFIENNKYYLEYVFDKDIKIMKSINFKDDGEQDITLTLFNTEKNIELNKSLFVFKNPRLYKNRK